MVNLATELNKVNIMTIKKTLLLTIIFSAFGCAYQDLNYEMGSSVAQMEDKHIYDRDNAANPPEGIVEPVDGEASQKALDSYREVETKEVTENVSYSSSGSSGASSSGGR